MIDSSGPMNVTSLAHCSTEIPDTWPYNEGQMSRAGLVVVLSGPSGVGKDAVIAGLESDLFPFTRIVTATTRTIRPGEVDGQSYHFLTTEEFTRWRDDGKFLEWATYGQAYYGTPLESVHQALAKGETVLLKIEVQGAAQIRQKLPDAIFIFLGPGSFEELAERLHRRGTESTEAFDRRIQQAREELAQLPNYDYLVINRHDELGCAIEQVEAIITAERLRVRQHPIRFR